MYSIIDSCDETSGWHLPGLHCVKETALSFVAQTSFSEHGGNLATMSPAGLNILRCLRVLLHTVDCTTERCQEREFILSRMWLAPFFVRYISVTSCLSSKWLQNVLRVTSAAEKGFSTEGSAAAPSFSSAKRNILLNHIQQLYTVRVMYSVYLIFVATNDSPMGTKLVFGMLDIRLCKKKF